MGIFSNKQVLACVSAGCQRVVALSDPVSFSFAATLHRPDHEFLSPTLRSVRDAEKSCPGCFFDPRADVCGVEGELPVHRRESFDTCVMFINPS